MTRALVVVVSCGVLASSAGAAILWDQAPTISTYGGTSANILSGTHWADSATFSTSVQVTRFVLFTNKAQGSSQTFRVSVFADPPPAINNPWSAFYTHDVVVPTIGPSNEVFQSGSDHVYAVNLDITTLSLGAGTYWFGAAGVGFDGGQSRLTGGGNAAYLNGLDYGGPNTGGDQAFQLVGSPVPEPATMVLCGLALGAAARRRARR